MSAPNQRFSILDLMGVVSILAAECGFLRFVLETTGDAAILVFPLLNFMLLGLILSRRDPGSRHFWVGFEGVGLAVLALLCFMLFRTPETLSYPLQWMADHHWLSDKTPLHLALPIGAIALVYGGPQLLVAWAGGWVWGQYRLVIERRPRETEMRPTVNPNRPAIARALPSFQDASRPAVG